MISTRLREETAWPILTIRQYANPSICELSCNILGSERAVVHQEQFNIVGVLDEERLVARRHHVAGLLVGTVSNLNPSKYSSIVAPTPTPRNKTGLPYRGHGSLSLEPSPHTVIDTLGLPPCRIDTLVAVALVAVYRQHLQQVFLGDSKLGTG